jgi:uncharacterized protein (DUF1501 family)
MKNEFNRRKFLKGLMTSGAMASLGGVTSVFPSMAHAAGREFDDYKAIVVLYKHGGNDSHNMVFPIDAGTNRDYDTYRASRGDLSINNVDLSLDYPPDPFKGLADGFNRYAQGTTGDPERYLKGHYACGLPGVDRLGINGMMPELAQLFRDRNAAIIGNVGTLVRPIADKSQFGSLRPPFLFAHNHQTNQMETGWASNASATGWAGRLADIWSVHQGNVNGGSPLGIGISYNGPAKIVSGAFNNPVVLAQNRFDIFPTSGFDAHVFAAMNSAEFRDSPLERTVKNGYAQANELEEYLAQVDPNYFADQGLQDPYGNPLFTIPATNIAEMDSMPRGGAITGAKNAALMVKLGQEIGIKRQVIFIEMGNFDHHDRLTTRHPALLRNFSLGVWNFQQAMKHLGLEDQVTTISLTEFARTLGNNGKGVDHAWAGHNFVIGGAVNGGKLYGEFPDMRLGGDSDINSGTSARGRMIPTTGVDQQLASVCDWFGVSEEEMWAEGGQGLFPDLGNFRAEGGGIRTAYIDGLMSV